MNQTMAPPDPGAPTTVEAPADNDAPYVSVSREVLAEGLRRAAEANSAKPYQPLSGRSSDGWPYQDVPPPPNLQHLAQAQAAAAIPEGLRRQIEAGQSAPSAVPAGSFTALFQERRDGAAKMQVEIVKILKRQEAFGPGAIYLNALARHIEALDPAKVVE